MRSKNTVDKVALGILAQNYEWYIYMDNLYAENEEKSERRSNLYSKLLDLALLTYHAIHIEKDYKKARYLCYNFGRMLEAHFWALQKNLYEANAHIDFPHFSAFVLWSDNLTLMKRFQHLNFQAPYGFGQDKEPVDRFYHMRKKYIYSLPGYLGYCLVNEDWDEIDKMVLYAEKHSLRRLDKPFNVPLQTEIINAIRNKDKGKLHDNLLELIQTTHTAFNPKRDFHGNVITAPAITYLKAAWLLGLEVEVKHHLVPMEMMPYQPLENYEDRYWFCLTEEEQKWQLEYSRSIPDDLYTY